MTISSDDREAIEYLLAAQAQDKLYLSRWDPVEVQYAVEALTREVRHQRHALSTFEALLDPTNTVVETEGDAHHHIETQVLDETYDESGGASVFTCRSCAATQTGNAETLPHDEGCLLVRLDIRTPGGPDP